MGECGCGEIVPEVVYQVGQLYLVINCYPGCSYCGEPPSVDLLFFDRSGYREFGQEIQPIVVWPDTYGGNDGTKGPQRLGNLKGRAEFGWPTPAELAQAAEEMAEDGDDEPFDSYDSLAEYLRSNGLEFMRRAMRISRANDRKQRAREQSP